MAYPWSFLKQFNFTHPPTIVLGRSEEVLDKYQKHSAEIKKKEALNPILKIAICRKIMITI